jgi:hypothetical protein
MLKQYLEKYLRDFLMSLFIRRSVTIYIIAGAEFFDSLVLHSSIPLKLYSQELLYYTLTFQLEIYYCYLY